MSLVLSRHPGEVIMIGDDIRVTVLDVRGGNVRLGIAAPRNVSVDREEIFLKKQKLAEDSKRAHS